MVTLDRSTLKLGVVKGRPGLLEIVEVFSRSRSASDVFIMSRKMNLFGRLDSFMSKDFQDDAFRWLVDSFICD